MSQLLRMAGVKTEEKGGVVPVCDPYGQTSIPGIFAAGDVSGIEEASSAMIGGHIAGIAAAKYGGFVEEKELQKQYGYFSDSLRQLRQGMFAPENRGKKDMTLTKEGCKLSETLLRRGYLDTQEIKRYPGFTNQAGIHPVIECTQNIPCNPCQDACRFGCIKIGENITSLPAVDTNKKCMNCGMCVASCPGQAIFLVNEDYTEKTAAVTLPYEFLPVPAVDESGYACDRKGKILCAARVANIKTSEAFDHTRLLTIEIPKEFAMDARFFVKNRGPQNG